jgi:hypothetical protein
MKTRIQTLMMAGLCLLPSLASLHAQVTSGSVSGTVLDAQGAAVANAKVTLTDEVQATTRSMATSSEGIFYFTPVLPSTYTVVVENPGFKKFEKKGIRVSPGDRVEVSGIKLDVGAVSETVAVQANAIALETETAQHKSSIVGQQVVDMPIVDRNFLRVLQVVPGYAQGDQYSANINGNRNDSMSIKLDGVSNMDSGVNMCCSTWVNMDTIAEVNVVTNTASAAVGHSGGAAVQVVTKGGTKEFHGSAYAFIRNESLNARGWNANSTAANAAIRKSTYRYNTDGFTLGGPIFIPKHWNIDKNKLFFFAAEEHQNTKSGGGNRNLTVPTALERTGDFSQSISNTGASFVIYDPTTGGQYYGGSPLPGNMIPANLMNKDGQKFLNLMPLPNNITSDHTLNYTYALTPTHKPELLGTYKFDYNINDKWRSFVRYTRDYYISDNYAGNGSFEFLGTARGVRKGMGAAWNVATTISPTFTNEFTMGVSQNLIPNLPIINNKYTRSLLGLSFQTLFPNAPLADEAPGVSFGGNYISNTPSFGTNNPNFADNTNFNWADNLAKVFSTHTLTFGVSIERDRKDQTQNGMNGSLSFSTSSNNPFDTGFTYADALVGNFNTFTQSDQQRTGKYRFTNAEWYVADTWKVTRKLTLDGGIRVSLLPPIYDAKGQLGQFLQSRWTPATQVRLYSHKLNPADGKVDAWDPVTNTFANAAFYATVVPNSGNPLDGFYLEGTNGIPRGLVNSRGLQYGPALGFAYAVNSKTVVRGGGRVAYDRIQGNPWYFSLGIPPTTRQGTLYYGNLPTLASTSAAYTPINPGNNGAGMSPDGKLPTVYSYNLSVQRELPYKIVAEASYVGNLNRHLDELVNQNMPAWGSMWLPQNQDPSFTGVNTLDGTHALPANFYRPMIGIDRLNYPTWGGTANYNSLQVTANRRAGRNLTLQLAYTFSKALGTADQIYNASAIPGEVRQANYGRLSYDKTHSLVVYYTYSFPKVIRGTNPFLNNFATRTVLNSWQVSGITTLRSGSPYSLSYSVLNQNLTTLLTGNPDYGPRATLIGDPKAVSGGTNLLDEFNLGAVTQTAKGSHGNDSGFNYMTGPWYWNTDMGVFKNVPITSDSKRYVQFRIEFYNLENHTNWGGVASSVQYSTLGPAGSTGTILNLPQYLVGAGQQNGGRFGVGAANGPGGGRIGEMSLKIYF